MKHPKPISIIASGQYLPTALSSLDLETEFHLPIGFSEKFSGVSSRHRVSFETSGYMGARAAEAALAKAGMGLSEIDLLISAGISYDYPLPSQSSVIKHEIQDGQTHLFPTFDIDSSCLSFVSAFEVAAKMLDGDQYKNILIVSSEISSKSLNPRDPETFTLFGDGAVAFIIGYRADGPSLFYKSYFKTYTEGLHHTMIRGGGLKYLFQEHPYDQTLYSFEMQGPKMLKLAQRTLPEFMKMTLEDQGIELSEIDVIVPHQASKAGLLLFKRMFGLDASKVKENISTHGNCVAASIPLVLHQTIEKRELQRGKLCMLFGTSAGFSIGSLLFRY